MAEVDKFTEHERDELYRLALKIKSGGRLEMEEKRHWAKLFKRFEALKKEKDV